MWLVKSHKVELVKTALFMMGWTEENCKLTVSQWVHPIVLITIREKILQNNNSYIKVKTSTANHVHLSVKTHKFSLCIVLTRSSLPVISVTISLS